MIDQLEGEYRFLSNFYLSTFRLMGKKWNCVEQWYVYHKVAGREAKTHVRTLKNPGEMKRFGQIVPESDAWTDERRLSVMRQGVRAKFTQNPNLWQKLLETGHEPILEGNDWGDVFWGVDGTGQGQNWLGRILMEVRDSLSPVPLPPSNSGLTHPNSGPLTGDELIQLDGHGERGWMFNHVGQTTRFQGLVSDFRLVPSTTNRRDYSIKQLILLTEVVLMPGWLPKPVAVSHLWINGNVPTCALGDTIAGSGKIVKYLKNGGHGKNCSIEVVAAEVLEGNGAPPI